MATKTVEMMIDPICGMKVEPQKAAGKSTFNGETFYFCSNSCKEKFDSTNSAESNSKQISQPTLVKLGSNSKSSHQPKLQLEKPVQKSTEEVENKDDKALLQKVRFALLISIIMLVVMLIDIIPSLHKLVAGWHQSIGVYEFTCGMNMYHGKLIVE